VRRSRSLDAQDLRLRRGIPTTSPGDADLLAVGLRVLRVTWRQIAGEPYALVARIARALG
jgi:hypothetical protein